MISIEANILLPVIGAAHVILNVETSLSFPGNNSINNSHYRGIWTSVSKNK